MSIKVESSAVRSAAYADDTTRNRSASPFGLCVAQERTTALIVDLFYPYDDKVMSC